MYHDVFWQSFEYWSILSYGIHMFWVITINMVLFIVFQNCWIINSSSGTGNLIYLVEKYVCG